MPDAEKVGIVVGLVGLIPGAYIGLALGDWASRVILSFDLRLDSASVLSSSFTKMGGVIHLH